jgi:pimeloyl-ACP methyl ester carboxylesterase
MAASGEAAGARAREHRRMLINGTHLHVRVAGHGPTLVLVHGSWTDHVSWAALVPHLARSFRVVAYDRRGHSLSARPAGPIARAQHEDDLATLIEQLDAGPALVTGSSYGGLVTLGLAARRPDLVRAVTVHEPPAAAAGEPFLDTARSIAGLIASGAGEEGARRFVEEVALGPGAWDLMPAPMRETFVFNAPTFVAEQADPAWNRLDYDALRAYAGPILVTKGGASSPFLQGLAERLATQLPEAETAVIDGAGHAPHLSHPEAYGGALTAFYEAPVATRTS